MLNSRLTEVVCLYDVNGLSAEKWADAGYDVYHYDFLTKETRVEPFGRGRKIFMHWDARDHRQNSEIIARHSGYCALVLAYPPCDDLAVSGTAHFAAKRKADPLFQIKAMELVFAANSISEKLEAPFAIENPVSMISSLWRKPNHIFDPHEFGGYLPDYDIHPLFPEYIAARDAYPKRTCYWTGNGFRMPPKKPVEFKPGFSKQYLKLGGKSAKTKKIRSMSPRGVGIGIFFANVRNEYQY